MAQLAPTEARWDFDCMPHCHLVDKLVDAAMLIAKSQIVLEVLEELTRVSRSDFKEMSQANGAAVWFGCQRGYQDRGNYVYSFLFQSVRRLASRCTELTRLDFELQMLGAVYTNLSPNAEDSIAGMALQGDVVECCLQKCYEQGQAVPEKARQQRADFQTHTRAFCEYFQHLEWTMAGEQVHVPYRSRPCTRALMNMVFYAYGIRRCKHPDQQEAMQRTFAKMASSAPVMAVYGDRHVRVDPSSSSAQEQPV